MLKTFLSLLSRHASYVDICSALERIALNISLTKQQHDVTHTIRQTEIPDLLGSRVTSTPSVKMSCGQKNCLSINFRKKKTACWSVVLLGLGPIVSVCCKTVCRWVTINCCFMSDMSERKTFQTNVSGTRETDFFFSNRPMLLSYSLLCSEILMLGSVEVPELLSFVYVS